MNSKALWQLTMMVLAIAAAGSACADTSRVNGSISIAANQQEGDVETVNGAISIGERATVKEVQTVNGAIKLSAGAHAREVSSVNGAIQLGEGAAVSGEVSVVNGTVQLDKGASVEGKLSTVNGRIELTAAHLGGDLETVNGALLVGADSRLDGDIRVRKPGNSWFTSNSRPVRVVIGPRAVVKGRLKFERPVKLYVSSTAKTGSITGALPISYTGDRPPD